MDEPQRPHQVAAVGVSKDGSMGNVVCIQIRAPEQETLMQAAVAGRRDGGSGIWVSPGVSPGMSVWEGLGGGWMMVLWGVDGV